jgi:quinol monooxygenase YgiN
MKRGYLRVLVVMGVIGTSTLGGAARAIESIGTITVVSHVDIIPDAYLPQSEENAAALFRAEINATRKDRGFVSYAVLRQVDAGNHFTILETWADSKAYAAHAASQHTITFRKDIQGYLGSPFDARIHQVFK